MVQSRLHWYSGGDFSVRIGCCSPKDSVQELPQHHRLDLWQLNKKGESVRIWTQAEFGEEMEKRQLTPSIFKGDEAF